MGCAPPCKNPATLLEKMPLNQLFDDFESDVLKTNKLLPAKWLNSTDVCMVGGSLLTPEPPTPPPSSGIQTTSEEIQKPAFWH